MKTVLPQEQALLTRWIAIRRYGLLLGDQWRLKAITESTLIPQEDKERHARRVAQELRQHWYSMDVEDRRQIMRDLQYYCQLKKHKMQPYLFEKPERVPIEVYTDTKPDITKLESNHFEGGGCVLRFPTKEEICRAQEVKRQERKKEHERWQ